MKIHFKPSTYEWGYSCPCTVIVAAVIMLVHVPEAKLACRFLPNFQDMFTSKRSRAY